MERKYIRADLFMNEIAGSAFFSAVEKSKIRAAIEEAPGDDVEPVEYAHLNEINECNEDDGAFKFVCSNCEQTIYVPRKGFFREIRYVFCPHCGAKIEYVCYLRCYAKME